MAIKLSEKNRLLMIRLLMVIAALILLVMLFMISPLRNIVFPSQREQDIATEDDSGVLPEESEADGGYTDDTTGGGSEDGTASGIVEHTDSEGSSADREDGGVADVTVINRPPVIEVFIIGPVNVMSAVRSGEAIPITFEEKPFWFTVNASDHEGEAIDFEINFSHGLIDNMVRPDDNTVQFIWVSPPNSEGIVDTIVNATVEVTAVDFSGGRDRAVINLAMTPESSEHAGETADLSGVFSVAQTYRSPAISDHSGYVNSAGDVRTGTIIVGDDDSNRQYKGYLTFSLAGIAGIPPDNINSAQIIFNAINKSGAPQTIGEFVDFKIFNYGSTLDSGDFAVGGNRFMMIGTGFFTGGSTAEGSLVHELRSIQASGGTTLQVKIGLDATTNNNNVWDMFQFNPGNVELVIDYLE